MIFLFFGSRTLDQKSTQRLDLTCSYCNIKGQIQQYSQSEYFHLFWIPIFRIKSHEHGQCAHCKKYYTDQELHYLDRR
ncbi:MAG: zinc-ribbon domain-containing protein [Flavobacteriaceae bacterium]|nr:zinc-ribbon domain-containing protein [Flavobacteriaceae bacterium]